MTFPYLARDFRASQSFADQKATRRIIDRSTLGLSRIAVLKSLVNLWYTHRYVAGEIHPGLARLAKAGRVSVRTITRVLAEFREAGFLCPTKNEQGGAGATRYVVNLDTIIAVLSPSKVVVVEGDLGLCRSDCPEPEYSDDGLPVLDAADVADFSTYSDAGENAAQPFDFRALLASLTLDTVSTGNKGRSKPTSPSIEQAQRSEIEAMTPCNASPPFGWQAGISGRNLYLIAKEGADA